MINFFKKFPKFRLLLADESEVELPFRDGQTVLEVALAHRIRIATSCGGMGTCGTCRVEVIDAPAELEERNEIECEMARERNFAPKERLACQVTICEGLKVRVPEASVEND